MGVNLPLTLMKEINLQWKKQPLEYQSITSHTQLQFVSCCTTIAELSNLHEPL